jgi:hypothetical protein
MSKSPRGAKPDWSRRLARAITLKDRRQLKSLHDARTVLLDVFGSVNARSGVIDHAIQLLLAAADSGKRADVAAATDAIERLLLGRRLL